MDYIENRISSLENRAGELEQHFNPLVTRVNDLENEVKDLKEQMNILADDYKIFRSEDHTDQSTEEFVKVVRCGECEYYNEETQDCDNPLGLTRFGRPIKPTDYCSRGERR